MPSLLCYRCNKQPCECRLSVCFSVDDAQRAADSWGFNCGPGALCALLGVSPDELRPHLREFERKRYTNPLLMYKILRDLGLEWRPLKRWPHWGLVRVQWLGPWMDKGVPHKARYRHTHWVGSSDTDHGLAVFDVNATCMGGWLGFTEWDSELVPWLLRTTEPKANGRWRPTHLLEFEPTECESAAMRLKCVSAQGLEQEVGPWMR